MNPRSPFAIVLLLLTVIATLGAIWFICAAFMQKEDAAAGVVRPPAEADSLLKQIFRTPEPAKQDDPTFNR